MRVLLVEDDPFLGDRLRMGLQQHGFQVDQVRSGDIDGRQLRTQPYAAAVLDLGFPGRHGMEVLAPVCGTGKKTPVLVLVSRDALIERVRGLDAAVDDFVVKPVDLNELAARLRALVRRAHGLADDRLSAQDVELDPAARTVRRSGVPITLSRSQFDLLQVLMLNAGRVLSRQQLELQLYAWGREVESNAIEVHVHHLRRKLGPRLIHTVRGVGYKLLREAQA